MQSQQISKSEKDLTWKVLFTYCTSSFIFKHEQHFKFKRRLNQFYEGKFRIWFIPYIQKYEVSSRVSGTSYFIRIYFWLFLIKNGLKMTKIAHNDFWLSSATLSADEIKRDAGLVVLHCDVISVSYTHLDVYKRQVSYYIAM